MVKIKQGWGVGGGWGLEGVGGGWRGLGGGLEGFGVLERKHTIGPV